MAYPEDNIVSLVQELQKKAHYENLVWEGSFEQYLDIVKENPLASRTSYQRIYDMIMSYGTIEYVESRKKITHYKFFDDATHGGKDALYGLDIPLMKLVNVFKSAAQRYGTEKRIILLHGPVGCAKSTICRLLKRGLEDFSKTPEGALYSFSWIDREDEWMKKELLGGNSEFLCPMHEDPLLLVPQEFREPVIQELTKGKELQYKLQIEGELCPPCRFIFNHLMVRFKGDWKSVLKHIKVRRISLSEKDRIGIGTFQPKDEKNQDSTELSGDINYRKIAIYGSDSDPRAFNFDGEFNIANRGMIEFIEILKLDTAFLYDLLGATQEHKIKPKKFAQTDIDEVIIGHTNEPEYRKLQSNEYMEALRDRTVKIDIPYITKLKAETKIYERDFNGDRIRGKHIAPHTLTMAAMWAILTRLESPKKANLSLVQKLKLYDGHALPGYTEENVKELRKETLREGLNGISPRYIQDKISNSLVNEENACLNPFLVLSELHKGLRHHVMVSGDEQRRRYEELLAMVRHEYEEIVKSEVQRAISCDDEVVSRLCSNYLDNVKAYTQRDRVKNRYTGDYEEPDERLMRSIEEKIDIPESRKDDFRREIMNYIGSLALEDKTFDYRTNERLRRALELKIFEDQKDTIKLSSLVSRTVDPATQERIRIIKSRLIKSYGYCEICSTDVLNFVASIYARGDVRRAS
ncbi:MAG: serine protein kinase [Deltaproteobacteria bacterium GWA2_38_16]|nr:MAG: serine protein kinase [Deltaproteobacteria bacterium GWA2_38_16]OGQ02607.1 MAG: serine protein kinase [Deltaproteobacteria bacterium RIFCSPHIGHO2_02_FULL_38_15]